MSTARGEPALFDLLEDLLSGRLDPEGHARLQARLKDHPDAQRLYLDYVDMHLALARLHRREEPRLRRGASLPARGVFAGPGPRRGLLAACSAAALLVIAVTALVGLRHRPEGAGRGAIAVAETRRPGAPGSTGHDIRSASGLALVVRLDAVRWQPDDGTPPVQGEVLTAQRFRVRSGRATLAFLNGVMLTLEGPADLELLAIDRVFCHRGRLRVRVPAGATGFVVAAPGASVVDLGTEFALNVADDGKARVMVFEGEAEAAVLGAAGASESSRLVEQSKAVEIDPRSGKIREARADTQSFVASPELEAPALKLDPAYPDAVLRSRPWGYWRFESLTDRATPNAVPGGPALRATGAVRVAGSADGNGCAVFAADGGVKYLELDGGWEPPRDPGYAVELWALAEEYNYSTLVALLAPMDNHNDGHFSLLELLACGRYPYPRVASVRFLHRWPPGGKGGVSIQNGTTYQLYRWHHLVAQGNGDRMELYLDGVLTRSEPLDPDRATTPCRMLVGRLLTTHQNAPEKNRPLIGRVDELALYDRPLSAEEVATHFQLATQGDHPR
jgi:hypothetical protein